MANFSFLKNRPEYALFAAAAMEAERVYASSPAMCAVGCRKALELAVKWVYSADQELERPYQENLQALLHESTFQFTVDPRIWERLSIIIRLGNLAVHTGRTISSGDALLALQTLFDFIHWIDYSYGNEYEERSFDEHLLPQEKVSVDTKKIKAQEALLEQKDSEIEKLQQQILEMSQQYTQGKKDKQKLRVFTPCSFSEFKTRQIYIDVDLKELGWILDGTGQNAQREFPVSNMAGHPGQPGFADYVLMGKDGLPLAVIEAKKTSKDPNIGRTQAELYADALEQEFGRRPMTFTSNGFETFFWDSKTDHQRRVSGFFDQDTLQKLMNRRSEKKDLSKIRINDAITDRYYQKEAIRAVCEQISKGYRKHLLVMATGTGKTRTASSLVDVLTRGGYVTNVLFLADRTALVRQARDDFKNYLPDLSLCNLLSNKDDRQARIVFSTYPTMLNAIDSERNQEGRRLFTPAHFDLIISDESHRSIFKKYRAIFDYFDAITVGLTATPKTDVDRNTYDFFEMEHGVPTYAYDYDTAVNQDHVLCPYKTIEVSTRFMDEGIIYEKLSPEDQERYREDFMEADGSVPLFIPSNKINSFVFNKKTVDQVLEDLMQKGIKINGGDKLAKTIIFAHNKKHAEFILERFNALYPQLKGSFAKRVICDDTYAQTIIDDFKQPAPPTHYNPDDEKDPQIVVSVDMMDTGIDVPQIGNLVFFKSVRSKTKFWQMIGRGTRLCKGMECIDSVDGAYTDKRRFFIFDYCGNFEYFKQRKEGIEGRETTSLSEKIFSYRIRLCYDLQDAEYAASSYQDLRRETIAVCKEQIRSLNNQRVAVQLQRQYVEKFRRPDVFICLKESEKAELIKYIAPLVFMEDKDEPAKRFDDLMYGLMIASIEKSSNFLIFKDKLLKTVDLLKKKSTIPQVKQELPLLSVISEENFWKQPCILQYEDVRIRLRPLIKFIERDQQAVVYTNLPDPVIGIKEGTQIENSYGFDDYKKKVNRYIFEHKNSLVIHKLTHNIPLTADDYTELERILTQELGTLADYKNFFQDTPFGLLIRSVAKLDHQAAMDAFSSFINDYALNQQQIAFVDKVISHIEQNGYMRDLKVLTKPPFDKPRSFIHLFAPLQQKALAETIKQIRSNAMRPRDTGEIYG